MSKGNFARPLQIALEMAGYRLARRNPAEHLLYKHPSRPAITIPETIKDPNLFYRLRALTEAVI